MRHDDTRKSSRTLTSAFAGYRWSSFASAWRFR
jgi:hypothetical protein